MPSSQAFQVRVRFPADCNFRKRDFQLFDLAGRKSDFCGSNFIMRDHGWVVNSLTEAIALKEKIGTSGEFSATIREDATSNDPTDPAYDWAPEMAPTITDIVVAVISEIAWSVWSLGRCATAWITGSRKPHQRRAR